MDKSETLPEGAGLEALADYLKNNQDAILTEWEKSIKEKAGEEFSTLAALSQKEFFNGIPLFIGQLCSYLRHHVSGSVKEVAREHGSQRWQYEADLRELTREWGQLHKVLAEQINRSGEFVSLSEEALAEAHRRLTELIHEGIGASVREYYRLQRQEAERQVRSLEMALREREGHTEQRGQNLHQVSHDLKGTMTGLRLNLELLQKADLGEQHHRLVERAIDTADSLAGMMENLLDLSRLEAGREDLQVEEFDVAGLLGSLCEDMQPMAGGQELELRCNGDTPLRVRGDRLKVRRIAQNLLQNALMYTQQGYVEIAWSAGPDKHWQLSIRDTGPGIDPIMATPFESKATEFVGSIGQGEAQEVSAGEQKPAKGPQQSEGIGLMIVRQLCNLLDAIVNIESEAGVGTTFHITFPSDYPD